jgi:hypothetical protein
MAPFPDRSISRADPALDMRGPSAYGSLSRPARVNTLVELARREAFKIAALPPVYVDDLNIIPRLTKTDSAVCVVLKCYAWISGAVRAIQIAHGFG